ncbi:MAG TPA: PIN domain-containing protein [Pyrinomonadaceae bacterium]|nr:PIN domain-containing protein [Pyrinomonadaceae bacterium]
MNEYVIDTHTLFWYLTNSPLLGKNAAVALDEADNGVALIHIPSIVFSELYFLNAKQKQIIDFQITFQQIKQSVQFISVPFEADDVLEFDKNSAVNEMHDRMIVGVARRLNIPLLTKDVNITSSGIVQTIW